MVQDKENQQEKPYVIVAFYPTKQEREKIHALAKKEHRTLSNYCKHVLITKIKESEKEDSYKG